MKILLVFDSARVDLYNYFGQDSRNEYNILYKEYSGDHTIPAFINKELFWENYRTPFKLLEEEKPDRIVFQEIFDIKQISLNIAARNKRIKTFFIDHGLLTDFDTFLEVDESLRSFGRRGKMRKLLRLDKIIKNYFFYLSVITKVSNRNKFKYLLFIWYGFTQSTGMALGKVNYEERNPDKFILFNKHNLGMISNFYNCNTQKIIFTGIPYFDSFYNNNLYKEEDYAVFIDHPNYEDNFYGWDEDFHRKLATALFEFTLTTQLPIIIKLHPRSNMKLWKNYNFDPSLFRIIQSTPKDDLYLNAKLIMGYSSTLLVGFISAKKNVVLVGWHPKPKIYGNDFSIFNVCHKSLEISELSKELPYWIKNNLTLVNQGGYRRFLMYYNHPFDGKAKERIIETISSEN